MTGPHSREVAFVGDDEAAWPDDAHHLADDAQRIGDVNQQIATEHHVERRVRKREFGRIALLKPHAWRILRPRLGVLHESGVELDADALTWFERVGETAGGVALRVDSAAAARHGLESGTVAEALQTARVGHAVGQILQGQIAFPLVVRYALDESTELDGIGMTQIQTPDRRQIPLSAVATIQEDRGPNFVMRENVQRRIVVQSNVSSRDLRSVVNDIQERVTQNVKLPRGYHVEYGGQFESEAQASRQLLWLSLGVIVAIFFILSAAFGSSRDGLLIMINLPLALIGGVIGVYLAGGVLSVASIVGFITLFGIATRNGIMLVSHIRHLQEHEGVTDFRAAVTRGATERLVPILMTALAAGMALVPIALSAGEPGSEIQSPMAMVIMFGLLSSTALNMIVVPILYERVGRSPSLRTASDSI
jgi:Cu/Ag efflux pump CusA